jgi:hypothetical protein
MRSWLSLKQEKRHAPAAPALKFRWLNPAKVIRSYAVNSPTVTRPQSPPDLQSREVKNLRDLTPQQWKTGIAAWLGWLFDG